MPQNLYVQLFIIRYFIKVRCGCVAKSSLMKKNVAISVDSRLSNSISTPTFCWKFWYQPYYFVPCWSWKVSTLQGNPLSPSGGIGVCFGLFMDKLCIPSNALLVTCSRKILGSPYSSLGGSVAICGNCIQRCWYHRKQKRRGTRCAHLYPLFHISVDMFWL